MMFSSRPPFNDDPYPWIHTHAGESCLDTGGRFAFNNGIGNEYAPRPEFCLPNNNPTNPILSGFRAERQKCRTRDEQCDLLFGWISWLRNPYWEWSPEHIEHARRVLTRLARFTEVNA